MKSKIIIYLFLALLGTNTLYAQKEIGIFIHGFQGGPEKWSVESLAPERLVLQDGVLDGYAILSYETGDLNEENLPALLDKFINQIQSGTCIRDGGNCVPYIPNFQDDKFVLIGHSLGGIVSRVLYSELRDSPISSSLDMDIVGVINIGGPVQGSGAVETTPQDVTNTFSILEEKLNEAWDNQSWLINVIVTYFIAENTDIGDQIKLVPEYLTIVRDSALNYATHIDQEDADELIGRDGSIIHKINMYPEAALEEHPEHFLSIIGAEKENVPFRIAGHIYTDIPEIQSEVDAIKLYNDFLSYFDAHIGLYEAEYDALNILYIACIPTIGWTFSGTCNDIEDDRDRAEDKADIWKDAKTEIESIDAYWGELVDSYHHEPYTYDEYLPYCENTDGGTGPLLDLGFPAPVDPTCSNNPNGEWITGTWYIRYADKTDGVVNIHSVLWSADDQFGDNENSYFDDVAEDGGYNHFELRNYERGYDLKRNDGSFVFQKGERAPQYDKIYQWLYDLFDDI